MFGLDMIAWIVLVDAAALCIMLFGMWLVYHSCNIRHGARHRMAEPSRRHHAIPRKKSSGSVL